MLAGVIKPVCGSNELLQLGVGGYVLRLKLLAHLLSDYELHLATDQGDSYWWSAGAAEENP